MLIEQRLKVLNTNAFAVENSAGLPPDAIRNVTRSLKNAGPTLSRAQEICDALGLEFYIGPPRETGPVEQVTLDNTEYANIDLHPAAVSAGPGALNTNSEPIDSLAFRRDWLRRLGVVPSLACLARVQGDSMFPTLRPGDMVLIDRSHTEPMIRKRDVDDKRRFAIYAFIEGGEARVKRLERPESGSILLVSDNPDFPPQLRTGVQAQRLQQSIIGKVVWWGHTVKE